MRPLPGESIARCSSRYERRLRRQGYCVIAGADEAGRGALFGPVFAAAVVLNPARQIRGLDDSKRLLPERREVLAARIEERALAWAVANADPIEIDRLNIYQASRLALKRAVDSLQPQPDCILVDAMRLDVELPQHPLIHGDALSFSIAAASILAKVHRDRIMREWDVQFPMYGLARHKGYATEQHRVALERHGATEHHRFTFEPVRRFARGLCQDRWGAFQMSLFEETQA